MKENTKNVIEGIGRFLGASAYSFTHMPIIVANEISLNHKKKRALKKMQKLHKEYTDRFMSGTLTEDNRERLSNEFLDTLHEFQGYYDKSYETGL